ncbi:MAG: YfhO family protein, partial [bacterium]
VYEVPNAMRRASLYHAYEVTDGDTTDLHTLFSDNFPYQRILLLREKPEFEPVLPDSGAVEQVEIVTHDVNYQKYRATLTTPGLLFVSENYFPGWQVKVDGQPAHLLRADHTFRAVSLPAGEHEVEFSFDWPRYENSKLVTQVTILLSLLGLAGCLVWEHRGKGKAA